MNLLLTVLEVVAPVFLLGCIGFSWVKLGFEYRIEFVTRLVMSLSVPCLIFVSLMQTQIAPDALSAVSMAAVLAYGFVTLACFLFLRLAKLEMRTFLAPLVFGNTGNLGLPLALLAFGQEGLSYAVVIFAIMAIYSFTFGLWLVAGGGAMGKVMKEPLVWATLLGAVFLAFGWKTPKFLTNTLEMIGQMAIPIMLITLGVALARLRPQNIARAFMASLIKIGICLSAAVFAAHLMSLDPVPFAVLVVQVCTPVAVTSYLLAVKYEADSETVAGLVVISTSLSIGYIPLILAFLL